MDTRPICKSINGTIAETECCGEGDNAICNSCDRLNTEISVKPFSQYLIEPDDNFCDGYLGNYKPSPSRPDLE